ncbi:MAG: glycosyltransferase family 39 protein [Elusimicrobia bacterium]|nr:glycosyltransferase family 39 protein [Elusimicrobiota bacterium]
MGPYKPILIIVLFTVAGLLPFVGRPVFVDDHAHFKEAIDLAARPASPYRMGRGELGWEKGALPTESNPPLYFYFMAAVTKMAGPETWKAHLAMMPFHLLALLCFYRLARRYVRHALWATLLWFTAPHFWLTANSLLLDGLLAPFMLAGLVSWIKGWEEERPAWLAAGALLLGMAALVKYTGILSLAAAAIWTISEGRNKTSFRWLFLLIPAVLLTGWMFWTRALYGESHLLATAKASVMLPSMDQVISLMTFSSGSTTGLLLALLWFLTARRRMGLAVLGAALMGGAALGWGIPVGLQIGFWMGAFLLWLFFIYPGKATRGWSFLILWAGVGLAGLLGARGWLCARYFVIVGPTLVLLTVMGLENRASAWMESRNFRWTALAFLTLLGGMLALADSARARVDVETARAVEEWAGQNGAGTTVHYPSALLSGLSHYLDEKTGRPLDPGAPTRPGDVIVLPERSLPRAFFPQITNPSLLARWEFRTWNPLRTLDSPSRAGFYGSIWGPLPFSFSLGPLEVFDLIVIG